MLSLDKELEKKVSKSEKEILKNKDDQMKNINNEIANITKMTVSKITNIKLSDSDIDKVIETHKGDFKLMFSDPQFWVAVSFILFIAAIFNPKEKFLSSSLDAQIKDIKKK